MPRNDADAAAAAAAGGGGGGGGGAASDSTAASAADTADDAADAAANVSVQPAVKYEHQFPALLILIVLYFFLVLFCFGVILEDALILLISNLC